MNELNQIKDIFYEIKNVSSKKGKEFILRQHEDNELFKECLKFLLDPEIVTGLSTKKMNKDVGYDEVTTGDITIMFDYLKRNNTGRDEDIRTIKTFCKIQEDTEFWTEFFSGKFKCGLDVKGVNKVYGNDFIEDFTIMLAESYSKNKNKVKGKEFILTTKLDGSKIIVIKENDKLLLKTRQNKLYENLVDIENEFKLLPNGVYDGEILAIGNFENSADQYKETMKRSRIKGIKKGLKMVCYDYVENINDFKNKLCKTKCIDRKNKLKEILNRDLNFIEYLEPLYIGDDITKISEYSNKAVLHGDEGIMLSIADSPYECKRSKNLLKVKEFHDGEVLVTEIIEGTGKYINKLGAVKCQFKYNDKVYEVEVGSGWQDNERELLFNNPELILDKVISIRYFEISQNSTTGDYSLRFPTINLRYPDFIRTDKDGIEDTNID